MFGSGVLVLGIWKCWFSNVEAAGGKSGRLAPPCFLHTLRHWSGLLCPGLPYSFGKESQGGPWSRVARRRRRDDQSIKC